MKCASVAAVLKGSVGHIILQGRSLVCRMRNDLFPERLHRDQP